MSGLLALLRRALRGSSSDPRHKLHAIRFRRLAEDLRALVELCDQAGDKLAGQWVIDRRYVATFVQQAVELGREIVFDSDVLAGSRPTSLYLALDRLRAELSAQLSRRAAGAPRTPPVVPLRAAEELETLAVGEPARRLLELGSQLGVAVPEGFVVTGSALVSFLEKSGQAEAVRDWHSSRRSGCAPEDAGGELRRRLLQAALPEETARAIEAAALAAAGSGGRLTLFPERMGEVATGRLEEWDLAPSEVKAEQVAKAYRSLVAELLTDPRLGPLRQQPDGSCEWPSVTCLRQPEADLRGVLLTCDPDQPTHLRIEVEGRPRQVHRIERHAAPGVGLGSLPEELLSLPRTALVIERFAGKPQALVWALGGGTLFVLQCAELAFGGARPSGAELAAALERQRRLFAAPRPVAMAGFSVGAVCRAPHTAPAEGPPRPRVLVLDEDGSAPGDATLRGAAAVLVADRQPGPWLALARDLRLPVLTGLGAAASRLEAGEMVTVDAHEGLVYRGVVDELVRYHLAEPAGFQGEPEYRLLRRAIWHLAPFHTEGDDPPPSEGAPRLFDVVAAAHERALRSFEGLRLGSWGRWAGAPLRGVSFPAPIRVVDAGGGVAPADGGSESGPVEWRRICSDPLRALLASFAGEAAVAASRGSVPAHVLAVLTEERVALDVARGGHTLLVDACLGEHAWANYVYCVFRGPQRDPAPGPVTDAVTRGGFRRLALGSGLTAWVSGRSQPETRRLLGELGGSVGCWLEPGREPPAGER